MSSLLSRFMKLDPKEMDMMIELVPENIFDSQYKYPPVSIFYNEADLKEFNKNYSGEPHIMDFLKLIDAGIVAIYSETSKVMVSEIRRIIYDNPLERRNRYYLPDGTLFIDVKTMCKTPAGL